MAGEVVTQPNSTALPSRTIEVEFRLRQTWEIPDDGYAHPGGPVQYVTDIMSEYLAVPGDSSLDEDYGREAWGGWDGPVVVSSTVVVV